MNPRLFEAISPVEYTRRFLAEGLRTDGRQVDESRAVTIADGGIGNAEYGETSCVVRIGNTCCLAGIKSEVMVPQHHDRPREGRVVVQVHLLPMSAARNQQQRAVLMGQTSNAGMTGEEEVMCQALIEEFVAVTCNLEDLCIEEGAAVWSIYLDCYCLEDDGCSMDAALLASCVALSRLRLPEVEVTEEGEAVVRLEGQKSLKKAFERRTGEGSHIWLPLSFAWLTDDAVRVVDPSSKEQHDLSQGCSATVILDGNFNFVQLIKTGGAAVPMAQIVQCIDVAQSTWRKHGTGEGEVAQILMQQ